MEETKQLKDAIRLRDAYILFMESFQDSESQVDSIYKGDDNEGFLFYRDIEILIDLHDTDCACNVRMMHFKHTQRMQIEIVCYEDHTGEAKIAIMEILKDYKDLIK